MYGVAPVSRAFGGIYLAKRAGQIRERLAPVITEALLVMAIFFDCLRSPLSPYGMVRGQSHYY